MQKHTERRQLNNEGFSLIELLIAIVILSIIVVPLLHSFVTSARTNAKSRNTMHATAIAEDVMEQFEAHTLEEMADTYETATPTDFTNNVQRDVSLDVDGDGAAEDGIWQYTFRDEKTTSGTYDVVVTLAFFFNDTATTEIYTEFGTIYSIVACQMQVITIGWYSVRNLW